MPIATCSVADVEDYARRGGRFGAHNIHERVPCRTSWHSDRIIIGTFFNGGLRAHDISEQYRPEEVVFAPDAPRRCAYRTIQRNDVFVDCACGSIATSAQRCGTDAGARPARIALTWGLDLG